MKATSLAKLIDVLMMQQIKFSIDEVHGETYQEAFQALSYADNASNILADGLYLRIWTYKNSLMDDVTCESIAKFLPEVTLKTIVFNILCKEEDSDEWLYIIKIED